MKDEHVLNFLFELGQLRRIKHEGWRMAGVENPESVAAHSLRAAQVGYVLAYLEKYPHPEEVATILVFHDIGETRIGDLHKVAARYVEVDEERAVREQLAHLDHLGEMIFASWHTMEAKTTIAGIIAKDADYLEQAITAKEYMEVGYPTTIDWIKNTRKRVQTQSAKRLIDKLLKAKTTDWWKDLKHFLTKTNNKKIWK